MQQNSIYNTALKIKEILDSKKAEDVEIIDLLDRGYLADFVVLATASVGKHSLALLNYLKEELKPSGVRFYNVDEESEDWIIVDLGEIIVHIFTENHRKKYNLEEFLQKTFVARQAE